MLLAVVFNPVPGDPPLCTFTMYPLFNTPDSDPQLIRREFHGLHCVCLIRETYKMCRSVGPRNRIENHCARGTPSAWAALNNMCNLSNGWARRHGRLNAITSIPSRNKGYIRNLRRSSSGTWAAPENARGTRYPHRQASKSLPTVGRVCLAAGRLLLGAP